jgi:amidase
VSSTDLHYLELTELARRLHAREISPVEATRAQLDRIEKLDGRLRSYALVTPELALEQARVAESEIQRGQIRGPLHGVPIAVKDLCWTEGIATAAGMPIHRDNKPKEDATVVRKLREVGSVLSGKLQLTEGAFAEHHPAIKPPVNPWHGDHWSGASSSGSGVATAAGLCYGSLGSDTGGSIRFPSAANGVTGLKPTWGRVSRHGVFELAATLDHIGPMARSAADTAAMLGAIAGPDENDPTASREPVPNYLAGIKRGLKGLRVGVDADWNDCGADQAVTRAMEEALGVVKSLGGEIRDVRFPDPKPIIADWVPYCAIETAVAHEATYPARESKYGAGFGRADLPGPHALGHGLPEDDPAPDRLPRPRGGAVRDDRPVGGPGTAIRLAYEFDDVHARTRPRDAHVAPALHRPVRRDGQPNDHPAHRVHRGWHAARLPVRGRGLRRGSAVPAGYAFQQATDWHRRHPALD